MDKALAESLEKGAALKQVKTKTGGGPSDAEIAQFAKIYTDNGGDLAKIAAALKVKFKDGAKVKDAEDFAKQFLAGIILAE